MSNKNIFLKFIIKITLIFIFSAGMIYAETYNLTINHLDSWLTGYEDAWESLNADKAAQLFTENARYQESPYKEPFLGREGIHKYWETVTADQKDVDFTYNIISVTGNKGIVHWHSELVQPSSGSTVILDGIFILEFSKEGLCENLKEWWHFQAIPAGEN